MLIALCMLQMEIENIEILSLIYLSPVLHNKRRKRGLIFLIDLVMAEMQDRWFWGGRTCVLFLVNVELK